MKDELIEQESPPTRGSARLVVQTMILILVAGLVAGGFLVSRWQQAAGLPSPSAVATLTPQPTITAVNTATPQPTATPMATATPMNTATPQPTATPPPTLTPLPTVDEVSTIEVRLQRVEIDTTALRSSVTTNSQSVESVWEFLNRMAYTLAGLAVLGSIAAVVVFRWPSPPHPVTVVEPAAVPLARTAEPFQNRSRVPLVEPLRTVPEPPQNRSLEPEKLDSSRPPTEREKRVILEHYHRLHSKTAVCRQLYGYKNADTWRYVSDVIDSVE